MGAGRAPPAAGRQSPSLTRAEVEVEEEASGFQDRSSKLVRFILKESWDRGGLETTFSLLLSTMTASRKPSNKVLSDVCRKYTQRDIVGEDSNCLIQFDEMLAEITQQLEESSIDECPIIVTGAHYVEVYSTFCAHANNVIGPHYVNSW